MAVSRDRAGNLYARPSGSEAAAEIWSGSHLDTVPSGGRFDGALGVVAAIEAVAEVAADRPGAPLAVVVFRDEEGWRFGDGCFGSRCLAGQVGAEDLARRDSAGVSVAEALAAPRARRSARRGRAARGLRRGPHRAGADPRLGRRRPRRRRRDRRDRRLRPDVPRRVRPRGNGADGGPQRRLLGVRRARVAPARARARDPGLGRDDRRRLGRRPSGERHPRRRPRDGRRPRAEPRGARRHRRRRARPGLLRGRPARMQRRRHPRLALRAGRALGPRPRRRPRSGGEGSASRSPSSSRAPATTPVSSRLPGSTPECSSCGA